MVAVSFSNPFTNANDLSTYPFTVSTPAGGAERTFLIGFGARANTTSGLDVSSATVNTKAADILGKRTQADRGLAEDPSVSVR